MNSINLILLLLHSRILIETCNYRRDREVFLLLILLEAVMVNNGITGISWVVLGGGVLGLDGECTGMLWDDGGWGR